MPLEADLPYNCPYCGEQNYIGFDPDAGNRQSFVEDCPVCCNPIEFVLRVDESGNPFVQTAERENP